MICIIPDELHPEILEHLPPRTQSLTHASGVCKAWRRIVNDPGFLRRYSARHGTPVTMGFFHNSNAIPHAFVHADGFASFSFERPNCKKHSWKFMDCRHGRVLLYDQASRVGTNSCFLVWHPMTGYCSQPIMLAHSYSTLPSKMSNNAALICGAGCDGDNHHMNCKPTSPFRVAVICSDDQGCVYASVFSSLTGLWSPKPWSVNVPPVCNIRLEPSAIVGNTMYQTVYEYRVLAFDMEKCTLTVFERPRGGNVRLMKVHGGARLGLAAAQDLIMRLWVRDTDADGGWVLHKTVDLGAIVSGLATAPLPWMDSRFPMMHATGQDHRGCGGG